MLVGFLCILPNMAVSNTHSSPNITIGNRSSDLHGPRVGMYYGIVIDQDRLVSKLDPLDVAVIIESVTGICPYDSNALWRLDYDHCLSYHTIIIYHVHYSQRRMCPGYNGGWNPWMSTEPIPSDISTTADDISKEIERVLRSQMNENSFVTISLGYAVAYFAE